METDMNRSIGVSVLILALLGGCDSGASEGAKSEPVKIKAANPFDDQIKGLSEINRGLALKRAIQDAGERCKKVEAANRQESYKTMSMWTARCSDSGDWALFIAPNGDVQVRKCDEAAELKLPACKIEDSPEPA
jgi:hypothetical protein